MVLQAKGKEDCDLPCTLDNLKAVLGGFRYHLAGNGILATLERQAHSVRLSLKREGYAEFYTMPLSDFEKAIKTLCLGTPGDRAYVS